MAGELKDASHPCPVPGCVRLRKPEHLMCWHHWRRVPKALRDVIWATVGRDQARYDWAVGKAMEVIAKKEGADVPRMP